MSGQTEQGKERAVQSYCQEHQATTAGFLQLKQALIQVIQCGNLLLDYLAPEPEW